ncbi:MAG: helix-turn-helix transcriptional regulator [Thermoguttaceae bacterium]|nr:helix-turn-helix transcriptional regulator [Thermoguttaceae bacterium]MBQ7029835.1 helix-turn-helix transcriptional regulator [Thermoguttaceae bacterium]
MANNERGVGAPRDLPACPVEATLKVVGGKWNVLILRDLIEGTKRFGELKRSVGNVSQKVLTAALRELEANGLITRTVFAEVPPRVEYATTELGRSLKPVLDALRDWGERFQTQTATRRSLD